MNVHPTSTDISQLEATDGPSLLNRSRAEAIIMHSEISHTRRSSAGHPADHPSKPEVPNPLYDWSEFEGAIFGRRDSIASGFQPHSGSGTPTTVYFSPASTFTGSPFQYFRSNAGSPNRLPHGYSPRRFDGPVTKPQKTKASNDGLCAGCHKELPSEAYMSTDFQLLCGQCYVSAQKPNQALGHAAMKPQLANRSRATNGAISLLSIMRPESLGTILNHEFRPMDGTLVQAPEVEPAPQLGSPTDLAEDESEEVDSSSTVTDSSVSNLKRQVLSSQMTSSEMLQCLIDHGCEDLTSLINPEKYSSCRVAEGGFGDVWKGKLNNGTGVAVKVLRCALVVCTDTEKKGLKRMMREGRMGMVSEWMKNGNLRTYLARNPDLDIYKLCIQIATGVEYIHGVDMVHGDLKASNILVSADGVAKLTDFDYSLISDLSLLFTETTRVGGGTIRWMAPELVIESTHQRSKETDIYALGMTFLEIMTGSVPYYPECSNEGQVVFRLIQKILPRRHPEYFGENELGNSMWALLTECWNHNPGLRPKAQSVLAHVTVCSRLWGKRSVAGEAHLQVSSDP
ncbi:hypothetical protein OPQ81_003275 [Rhizoctonia solani]|nr:hypothetical protein OPQ81_003275 [Rhizoctonia solani]